MLYIKIFNIQDIVGWSFLLSPPNAPETQVSGFFILKTAEVLAQMTL